jgi:N-acyl-D-aspartate/D-glutamate deacylase
MVEYDYLINNAIIVEGTGITPYKGSIGIINDKIFSLGDVKGDTKQVIDAEGKTALPGFIDAHSHFDQTMLWYPDCENGVLQGITTFIGGQCGHSMAPIGDLVEVPIILSDHLLQLDPFIYYPNKRYYPLDQVNNWMKEKYNWEIDWKTMGDYFKKVESVGTSMNYAPLVGHATIRRNVLGVNSKRNSTKKEMKEMRELIDDAMKDGCIGMSAGLDYDPDVYASTEEIIDGVSVLKEYNGVYCPHWRKTGIREGATVGKTPSEPIKGILESIEIHKKTGVRLHYAHLRSGWNIHPTPSDNLEKANIVETIETIIKESKNELDITWDTIPSLVFGGFTWIGPYLASLLEPWLRIFGDRKELSKWLKSNDLREEIKRIIYSGTWSWVIYCNPSFNPKWAESLFITKSKSHGLAGLSLAEIANKRNIDPFDTIFDIITEDHDTMMYPDTSGMKAWERDSQVIFYKYPQGSIGLDTWALDDKYESPNPPFTRRGINSYNAFPLFLKKYVLDNKIFTIDQAVQKTSTSAARVHNLTGRGELKEGMYADIVLMDLTNLTILADTIEPRKYAKGIEYVFVNGTPVVENRVHTGKRPGKVLKRIEPF